MFIVWRENINSEKGRRVGADAKIQINHINIQYDAVAIARGPTIRFDRKFEIGDIH